MVADTLGVNRSTARRIVARYIRESRIHEKPQGGWNHVRVVDEMRDYLEEIINENCLLTLLPNQSRTAATPSGQANHPRPHSGKNTRWDALQSETGKTPLS